MKLKFLFAVLLMFIISVNFAQIRLNSFHLGKNMIAEVGSETPVSNSINDIVCIGDTVWISTSKGVSKTTDGGASWVNFYGSESFGSESSLGIAYKNGIFVASTAHSVDKGTSGAEGSGIRLTTDGGNTWYSAPQSLDSDGDSVIIYGINKVRALPVTVAIDNISYDVALTSKYIWTANFAGGLRRVLIDSIITNKNTKWERILLPSDNIDSIYPTDTIKFNLQPVAGKFGNESWLNHRVFSVIAIGDYNIIAGTAGGINISTDGGTSWRKVNHQNQENPISGNFIVSLGYNQITKTIWAATWLAEKSGEFYAVSYSTDMGEAWQTSLDGEKCHGFGFKGQDAIAAADDGLFRTNNNGNTWITLTAVVDNKTQVSLNTKVFYSAAGNGNDVWIGSESGLAKITEAGDMWEGDWKVFLASKPLTSQTETYAYPNPFSPDAEVVNIKYSTGGIRKKVTIRIMDFGMNLVRTIVQNAERGDVIHTVDGLSGSSTSGVVDNWDGKDEAGRIVPNGVYFYRIDFDSGDPVFGKIIVLM
jgi:hypothetical protein